MTIEEWFEKHLSSDSRSNKNKCELEIEKTVNETEKAYCKVFDDDENAEF